MSAPSQPSSSGRLPRLLGENEVVRLIARGGMGAVFEVKAPRTGVRYAAKIVLKGSDPKARARFQREAELLARCDRHPGIVKVHAAGESPDGGLFVLLDLVEGEGLDVLLEREGKLEARRAATLARAVADALGFVHAQGVVHRDVKPSNILLDASSNGAPKLTDFGLATAQDVERLTRTGHFLGTVSYCAPEQVAGQPCGPEADVFALGCVLYRALTGAPPFDRGDEIATLARLTSPEPASDVRLITGDVPEALSRVVARALEKDPARRYRNGSDLAAELDRFLAGERVLAARPRRGHRARIVVGVLALAVVVSGVVVTRIEMRRKAAGRTLALGRDALDRATRALARAREPATAAVTSASPGAFVEAAAAAREALDRLEQARTEGASEAAPALVVARSLLDEAERLEAERELAAGRAAAALAHLDGGDATSSESRLVRARALVALERMPEARREVDAALASLREDALSLERAGDVLLAVGDPREAEKVFTRAFELASRRKVEIRAKRGAAAFRAGDDARAQADLAALVPDPTALPEARAANERLAPLAPVLYRRGLSASGLARDADLDGAWRLADPPPELARDVAKLWGNASVVKSVFVELASVGGTPTPDTIQKLRRGLARQRRAVAIEPKVELEHRWEDTELLRGWIDNFARVDNGMLVTSALLPAWPDHPGLLYMMAKSRYRVRADDPDVLALCYAAMDAIPADMDANPGVVELARSAISMGFTSWIGLGSPRDLDDARFDRCAGIVDAPEIWVQFSMTERTALGNFVRSGECLERARRAANRLAGRVELRMDIEREAVELLMAEEHMDAARAHAIAIDQKLRSAESLELAATAHSRTQKWNEVVALVEPRADRTIMTLTAYREALVSLGRAKDAERILGEIEALRRKGHMSGGE